MIDFEKLVETVKATGTRQDGQSLSDRRVLEETGRRRLHEAIEFKNVILAWFGNAVREAGYTRWQGYFAASLLPINLRAGCPADAGGVTEFDNTAASATEWYKARNPVTTPKVEIFTVESTDEDATKGAGFAQKLLEWFEDEIQVRGLDRWQGHFASALFTVELRSSCPVDAGGTALFDDAANAAWKFFDMMIKIA